MYKQYAVYAFSTYANQNNSNENTLFNTYNEAFERMNELCKEHAIEPIAKQPKRAIPLRVETKTFAIELWIINRADPMDYTTTN
jgi:hypothetical protein